jgi:hypothetical protein
MQLRIITSRASQSKCRLVVGNIGVLEASYPCTNQPISKETVTLRVSAYVQRKVRSPSLDAVLGEVIA